MSVISLRDLVRLALLLCVIVTCFFSSCVSSKKVIYFNDIPDTMAAKPIVMTSVKYVDPVILPNDILNITVQTMQQNESNTPITSGTVTMFNPLNGFLVDKNGNIELSLIGFVKVGGLTTSEARELIKEKAKEFYKEPVVNCRISNFEVNLLGEINAPGTYTFPSEKVNVLEALAAGHDAAITGKRHDVLLIRTEGDERKFVRLDLNSSDLFRSPYFYLRQRDILYVEPTKFRVQSSDNTLLRNIGIFSSLISVAAILLAFRNVKF